MFGTAAQKELFASFYYDLQCWRAALSHPLWYCSTERALSTSPTINLSIRRWKSCIIITKLWECRQWQNGASHERTRGWMNVGQVPIIQTPAYLFSRNGWLKHMRMRRREERYRVVRKGYTSLTKKPSLSKCSSRFDVEKNAVFNLMNHPVQRNTPKLPDRDSIQSIRKPLQRWAKIEQNRDNNTLQ